MSSNEVISNLRIKIALAMAIIKRKPKNLSSKQYAEEIAKKIKERDKGWKVEAKRLEEQVQKLKQDLVLMKLQSSAVYQEELPATPPEVCLHPPPPSDVTEDDLQLCTIKRNAAFLQSITSLRFLQHSSALQLEDHPDLKDSLKETLLGSAQSVKEFLVNSQHQTSLPIMQFSVKCLGEIMECRLMEIIGTSRELVALSLQLVDELVVKVLRDKALNNHNYHEELCGLIIELSKSEKLFLPIARSLVLHIKNYSDHLREVCQGKEMLDPCRYENMYFIFSTLEKILTAHKIELRELKSDEGIMYEMQKLLEETLLHISSKFTLFAHYVWKIEGMLTQME